MAFPSNFTANAYILAPTNRASHVAAVLDGLERALRDQDADIAHRGEDFLEFNVTIGAHLMRDFSARLRPRRRWPFTFVSGGTVSVTEQLGIYRVVAELRTSVYPAIQLLPFLIGGVVAPGDGVVERLIFGTLVGLGVNGIGYMAARWQFGSWLSGIGSRITGDLAHGLATRPGAFGSGRS